MEVTIVLTLVVTINTAFLTIILFLSEIMIYVVKKLATFIFWGHFFGRPYRLTGIIFGLDTALTINFQDVLK